MKFKGDEIGHVPTYAQVEMYIAEKGFYITPEEVFDYWGKKDWTTQKGTEVYSLEVAIEVYNGVAIHRILKKNPSLKKELKKLPTKGLKKREQRQQRNRFVAEKSRTLIPLKPIKIETKENKVATETNKPYDSQLKDKRWKAFRTFVFTVRGERCEKCGTDKFLQVHHIQYKSGCLAWEYTCNDVMVVCGTCHQKIHGIK